MLNKIYKLEYTLRLESGLHIGGSEDSFDIGGADSTVIKNPLNNQPYIPGSSMKGKMRALLSRVHGSVELDKDGKYEIRLSDPSLIRIFQPLGEKAENSGELQITRAIFRDATLTEESLRTLQDYLGEGIFTEVKGENSIDPLKSKAANPRFIERVPAGALFQGEIILQVFEGDDGKAMMEYLKEGMNLLTMDYLGGSGSRGYGRVSLAETCDFVEVL